MEIPDLEIMGRFEGSDPASYGSLTEFEDKLKKRAGSGTAVYGIVNRELETFSSPFYQVTFRMYGVEAHFFERFPGWLEA